MVVVVNREKIFQEKISDFTSTKYGGVRIPSDSLEGLRMNAVIVMSVQMSHLRQEKWRKEETDGCAHECERVRLW